MQVIYHQCDVCDRVLPRRTRRTVGLTSETAGLFLLQPIPNSDALTAFTFQFFAVPNNEEAAVSSKLGEAGSKGEFCSWKCFESYMDELITGMREAAFEAGFVLEPEEKSPPKKAARENTSLLPPPKDDNQGKDET